MCPYTTTCFFAAQNRVQMMLQQEIYLTNQTIPMFLGENLLTEENSTPVQ